MVVDNVFGFPTTGVILIGEEEIAYSSVDRAYSTLSGLTRGVNGTTITNHLPGEQIIIDLPPVLLLNGGRGYAEPPKVIAYIDTTIYPAPRRAAILQPVMNLDTILRIDVVDPGSAPGTGTPEPGGLTSRELLDTVRRMAYQLPIVGVDVVEVSPPYDHADITALLGNRVVLEVLSGMARRRKDARDGTTWNPGQPILDGR